LDRRQRPGHASFGEVSGDQSGMGGPARMHRLDGRTVGQELEHAGCLAEGYANCSLGLRIIELLEIGRYTCCTKRATDGSKLVATVLEASGSGKPHANENFIPERIGTHDIRARCTGSLTCSKCCGSKNRAAMHDRARMRVIIFEAVDQTAINQRRCGS